MRTFEQARRMLEAESGGRNTILTDDIGLPSVMVRIPAFRWSDVLDGGEDRLCDAFIVGGREVDCIYVSKYLNVVEYDRAYSLPGRDPANMLTIDQARRACARKGPGWHLLSNAEWCAIAHWCHRQGSLPRGNTEFGHDAYAPEQAGTPAPATLDGLTPEARTLTGSGPDSWSHDGTRFGIFDLNGNIWDMVAGLRVLDGEMQIIPDNDSALCVDEGADSPLWRALDPAGRLVAPGSAGTYHYDGTQPGNAVEKAAIIPGGLRLDTQRRHPHYTGPRQDGDFGYGFMPFQALQAAPGVPVHPRLVQLGLFPREPAAEGESLFVRNTGERVALRGGSWYDGKCSGLWDLYLRDSRTFLFPDIGFRAAYVPL